MPTAMIRVLAVIRKYSLSSSRGLFFMLFLLCAFRDPETEIFQELLYHLFVRLNMKGKAKGRRKGFQILLK